MQKYVNLGSGAPEMDSIQVGDSLRVELFSADASLKLQEKKTTAVFGVGIGGSVLAGPQVAGDTVYVGACDKNFYAIDLKTGREKWRFAAQDIVWDFCIDKERIYFTSYDGCLYCVTMNGALVWKYRTPDKLACKPAVSGGKVFFTGKDGHLHALDQQTGRLLWKVVDNSPCASDPVVRDGVVYVGFYSGKCVAVTVEGEERWTYIAKGPVGNGTYWNGLLLFPSYDGSVYALRAEDGSLAWRYVTPTKLWASTATVDEGAAYVSSSGMVLYALRHDGTLKWKAETNSTIAFSLALDGKRLVVPTLDGTVYVVDTETGTVLERWSLEGKATMVTKHLDMLLFSCYDCKVIRTDASGKKIWMFPTSLSYLSPVDWESLKPETVTTEQLRAAETQPEPETYRNSRIVSGEGLGVYGGLNITYAGSGTYTGRARYGGHGRHGH